jgi:hypothetical protein
MTEEQKLSALLRLKRYEQPPPGYYDKLLQDIHRRQRAELLHRPLWKIAIERVQTLFGQHSMGGLSYAGAISAMVVVGITVLSGAVPKKRGESPSGAVALAKIEPVHLKAREASLALLPLSEAPTSTVAFDSADLPLNARLFPSGTDRRPVAVRQPRYVIDARPVSYEATAVSFNF